jgi:hypothetical protein
VFAELPNLFDEAARRRYMAVLHDIFTNSLSDANVKVSCARVGARGHV